MLAAAGRFSEKSAACMQIRGLPTTKQSRVDWLVQADSDNGK